MTTALPHLGLRDLTDLLERGRAGEELGAAVGVPAVVIEGPADPGDVVRAAPLVRSLPCVVMARAEAEERSPALGALVDAFVPDEHWSAIDAQIARTPLAAVSMSLLLRGGATRSVDEGLVAESATYSMLQAGPEFAAWRAAREVRAVDPSEVADPVLLTDRDAQTLRLTLNRPRVHNAWNASLRDEVCAALHLALADTTIRAVELRGHGPSFCSGGDLSEFGSLPDPATAHSVRLARSPARLLWLLRDRTVAHLHGACMGAGIELPSFVGRVVAAPDTVIALPELSLGLVPGAGGTVSMPRRIGRHRTALLALAGVRIDAPTALSWGLVDEIADHIADEHAH